MWGRAFSLMTLTVSIMESRGVLLMFFWHFNSFIRPSLNIVMNDKNSYGKENNSNIREESLQKKKK